MIGKKYSKVHPFFQVVVPPWIAQSLSESSNFKYNFKKIIKDYYPNVWIVNNEGQDSFIEGTGNSLIIRGDILPKPRPIFISLINDSVEDVLVTGDQSITDGLSCCSDKKKIWYQIAPWKQDLATELAKAIPDANLKTFKTSCGAMKGIHKSIDYTKLIKKYDFRILGRKRMDALINFTLQKGDPIIEHYMESVLHSYKLESVLTKLRNKI